MSYARVSESLGNLTEIMNSSRRAVFPHSSGLHALRSYVQHRRNCDHHPLILTTIIGQQSEEKGLSLQFINCLLGEKTWYELAVRRYCFGICLHVSGPCITTFSLLSDRLCPLELLSQNAVDSSPGGKSTMQVPGIFLLHHWAKSGRT